jgi:hypothetical protein
LYGFALSYPAGTEATTGYSYEPWHYRYLGIEQAAAWRASGLTLVEYLRGLVPIVAPSREGRYPGANEAYRRSTRDIEMMDRDCS